MLFFRIFQHLLPRSKVWALAFGSTIQKFFLGLSRQPEAIKGFLDSVYLDFFPATTRSEEETDGSGALEEWERQFGLEPTGTIDERRVALAAEWQANGGQSPAYIQGVLRAAGYDVYIHDWWSSGPPYVARDPRDYTEVPLIGIYQCTGDAFRESSQPQCSALPTQPQCNDWLANETYYLVNRDLTRRAPPPVPSDPDTFPYWFYVGGETFPDHAVVDASRRAHFERLLLKLRPTHLWIGVLVDYEVLEGTLLVTSDGDYITTSDGKRLTV